MNYFKTRWGATPGPGAGKSAGAGLLRPLRGLLGTGLLALLAFPATAQDRPEPVGPARTGVNFHQPVAQPRPGERYVLHHHRLLVHARKFNPPPDDPAPAYRDLARIARALNLTVLRDDPADPLTLHVYVQAIDPLTHTDWLWEGMPRRADSMQHLIDTAIARCRTTNRPLSQLIITGHSGVGGTAAFGSTLDDCVFRGRLTPYHRDQLARLRPYLADHATIEIRQCTAALGEDGTRLLTQIHLTTGATATGYFGDFYFGKTGEVARKQVDQHGVALVNR